MDVPFESGKTEKYEVKPGITKLFVIIYHVAKVDGHPKNQSEKNILHFIGTDAKGIEARHYEILPDFTAVLKPDPAENI